MGEISITKLLVVHNHGLLSTKKLVHSARPETASLKD